MTTDNEEDSMSVGLLEPDEVRAILGARLNSHEWWMIPWVGDGSGPLSQAIEQACYAGDAAADCEVFLTPGAPGGVFVTSVFRKRSMAPERLAEVFAELGMVIEADRLRTQDVLVAGSRDEAVNAAIAQALGLFGAWLEGKG